MSELVDFLRNSGTVGIGINNQAADEIERLKHDIERQMDINNSLLERIAELEAALQPFAKAHGQESPSLSLTLHDLRMAHQALQEVTDESD